MCSGLMLLAILMEKKLLKHFWENGKKYDKTFKTKKVIKRKGNKLYVTYFVINYMSIIRLATR